MLKGKLYQGETSRFTEVVKYRLPNGRLLHFYDCQGQVSYREERTKIKSDILNGEFHAIINVVCYGYNETANMNLRIFDRNGNVDEKYLQENRKIELQQLKEWIDDLYANSKIKWILTLINKEDIWKSRIDEVTYYYSEGEYAQIMRAMNRACKVHLKSYCSKISPFGERPMMLQFSERDKIDRHIEFIDNICKYIDA